MAHLVAFCYVLTALTTSVRYTYMSSDQGKNRTTTGQFLPGVSGHPAGRPRGRGRVDENELVRRRERILTRLDGWNNSITGLGVLGKDKAMSTGFSVDIVDSELGAQIWRGDAIGARIVELLPNEMLRQGYELCIGDDEVVDTYTPPEPETNGLPVALPTRGTPQGLKTVAKRNDTLAPKWRKHPSAFTRLVRKAVSRQRMDAGDGKKLQEKISKKLRDIHCDDMIREALHFERAVCAGALIIGANDYTTDLRQPLDLRKVRSLDYLTPIEARELQPLYFYNDPFAPNFSQPAIYQLVPQIIGSSLDNKYRSGITQIHESRLIVFPGIKTTRRNMSGVINGFGDNIFTRIYSNLAGYNATNKSLVTLLADFAQAVYKIKGLADVLTRDKNALFDAMMNVELGRSIARAIVIDEDEEFKRESTTMAGYGESLQLVAQALCAATGYPATLLLGKSPDGMNATGASDVRLFYDHAATGQVARVAPPVMRLVEVALACEGEDPDTINHSIEFCPLWQPTQKEICDTIYVQSQSDLNYVNMEAASPEEIALTRFAGDQVSFAPIRVDFEARHAQEAIAPPTVEARPPKLNPLFNQAGPMPSAALQVPSPKDAPVRELEE